MLQTPRLILRPWQKSDKPLFAKMNADPVVMRYYPSVLTETESHNLADRIAAIIEQQGWGFWALERREDNCFIGFTGLNQPDYALPIKSCTEVGWRLASAYWGQGYATEAAKASLVFAFNQLKLKEVYSFATVTNTRSQAVMQRIGMSDTGHNFIHPHVRGNAELEQHVLYKIGREEWLAQT